MIKGEKGRSPGLVVRHREEGAGKSSGCNPFNAFSLQCVSMFKTGLPRLAKLHHIPVPFFRS